MSPRPVSGIEQGRRAQFAWTLGLPGLVLLVFAGRFLEQQQLRAAAAAALGLGLLLWAVAALLDPRPRDDPGALEISDGGLRRLPLALAVPAAAVAWIQSGDAVFRPLGVAAWALALGLWIAAWWPRGPLRPAGGAERAAGRKRLAAAVLLLILAVGIVFRFHRLSEIPGEPNSDHVEDLLNQLQLDGGERPIFFPSNTGQAPLPFYWTHALHRVLGFPLHFLTLKISTASVSLLAIPAAYLLGNELGGNLLGLWTAALLAWSKWPTLGARRGLTFAWAVFPAALVLWALLKYVRRGDRRSALAAGFWLGVGQFGYNAFKITPVLVPLALGFALFDRRWRGRRARLFVDGVVIAVTALLVFLPLLHYMAQRPEMFWYRALTRAGTRERPLPGPALWVFAGNLKNMALAFHWRGDGAWINTVQGEPFLDVVTGALFLAGVVLAFRLAARGEARWSIVLLSLFFLTLASTLALAFPEENPGINRAAVAAPSVFLLAALPAAYLLRRAREQGPRAVVAVLVVLAGLAAFSIQQNFESYFTRFDRQNRILLDPVMEVARVVREYGAKGVPRDNVYLLSTPHWIDARNLAFELDDLAWADKHNVLVGAPVPDLLDRPLLFLCHPSDGERREQLRRTYPAGSELLVPQFFRDRNFEIYYVPK